MNAARSIAASIIPYDPVRSPRAIPGAGVFDLPLVCLRVNTFWASYVDGVLERLAWEDAWAGTPEEVAAAIQSIERVRLGLSDEECGDEGGGESMFRLRQNPSDTCQLQQSWDAGVSWELAFDYGLCAVRTRTTASDYVAIPTIINNISGIDIGELNFAPQVSFTYSQGDTNSDIELRHTVLCEAMRRLITILEQVAFSALNGQIDDVENAVGAATVIAGIWPDLSWSKLLALGAGITTAAIEIFQQLLILLNPLVRPTAAQVEELACAAYKELSNRNVSITALEDAFCAAAQCLTGIQNDRMTGYCQIMGIEERRQQIFNAWFSILDDLTAQARAGVTYDCPCNGEGTWCHIFNLNAGQTEWQIIDGTQVGNGVEQIDAGNQLQAIIQKQISLPTGTTITSARAFTIPIDTVVRRGVQRINGVDHFTSPDDGTDSGDGLHAHFDWEGTLTGGLYYFLWARSAGAATAGRVIDFIRMEGTGSNPFAACDSC